MSSRCSVKRGNSRVELQLDAGREEGHAFEQPLDIGVGAGVRVERQPAGDRRMRRRELAARGRAGSAARSRSSRGSAGPSARPGRPARWRRRPRGRSACAAAAAAARARPRARPRCRRRSRGRRRPAALGRTLTVAARSRGSNRRIASLEVGLRPPSRLEAGPAAERRDAVVDDAGRGAPGRPRCRARRELPDPRRARPASAGWAVLSSRAEIAQHAGPQALRGQHEPRLQLRWRRCSSPTSRSTCSTTAGPSAANGASAVRSDRRSWRSGSSRAGQAPAASASSSRGSSSLPQAPDVALDPLTSSVEPIEQRRLQPLAGRGVSHRRPPVAARSTRMSSSGCSPASVASMRWPRPTQLPPSSCRHSVRRARRSASSPRRLRARVAGRHERRHLALVGEREPSPAARPDPSGPSGPSLAIRRSRSNGIQR